MLHRGRAPKDKRWCRHYKFDRRSGNSVAVRLHLIVLKVGLKGQCQEIFCFWFFSWIIFPQASDNSFRVISNLFENSRRYLQVKVHDWYQRHLWHIVGTLSDCWHLKVKIIYMLTLLLKGVQKNVFLIFWLKIFFICHRRQRHQWCTLSCEYLREFSKKFKTVLMGILWGWGKTDSWKKPEVENLMTMS